MATITDPVDVLGYDWAIEDHPAHSLLIGDERVQRPAKPLHLKDIKNKLNPNGIGVIHVSRRDDGKLYVIDGQHRILALLARDMLDFLVTCKVYEGLTIAQEAGLFRLLNNSAKTSAIDDLLKAVVEGDEEALAIAKIAERNGLRIAEQSGAGVIACAAAMRKVYRSGETGPAALGFALHVGVQSWGAHSDSVDGYIVQGLGGLYGRYGEDIDRAALIKKLAKHKGGARGLIGQAKTLAELLHVATHRGLSHVVLGIYNRGRREAGQLPPL